LRLPLDTTSIMFSTINSIMQVSEILKSYASPFKDPIGEHIGTDHWRGDVRELGRNWVVKTRTMRWLKAKNWKSDWIKGLRSLESYFGDFIPNASFVEGLDHEGKPNLLLVQRRVDGKLLRDCSFEELTKNPITVTQLHDFAQAVSQMYKDTGRMPDIHGSPHLKRQYQTKFTDSIMVEPSGRIRLVDVDMLGPLWHPNPFGKVHMFIHRRGLAKLVKKLDTNEKGEK